MAEKSARNVVSAIQKSKGAGLERLIYALGIRHVGEHIAGVLVNNLGTMEKLMDADEDSLIQVREVGPEVAQSIIYFFKQNVNRNTISRLKKAGVSFTPVKRATNDL